MKKYLFLIAVIFTALASSCSDEKLGGSIFDDSERTRNEFDRWLLSNYTYPYNIDFKYRMEDIESDMTYTLAPAEVGEAVKLAKLTKFLWLESYDEIAGVDFTRTYIPKVIHLIGSPAYNINGSMVLGTAEGGLKVTLYNVNNLTRYFSPAYLNEWYFKTMHHEFAHILNQTKKYDPEFAKISDADYIGGDWVNIRPDNVAYKAGFVSPYSMDSPGEDFAELFSIFVTSTQDQWDAILSQAGTSGAPIISRKFEIVVKYLKDAWKIDLYELRDIVQRRSGDIYELDLENL